MNHLKHSFLLHHSLPGIVLITPPPHFLISTITYCKYNMRHVQGTVLSVKVWQRIRNNLLTLRRSLWWSLPTHPPHPGSAKPEQGGCVGVCVCGVGDVHHGAHKLRARLPPTETIRLCSTKERNSAFRPCRFPHTPPFPVHSFPLHST